jgi:subtilisin family serine protease
MALNPVRILGAVIVAVIALIAVISFGGPALIVLLIAGMAWLIYYEMEDVELKALKLDEVNELVWAISLPLVLVAVVASVFEFGFFFLFGGISGWRGAVLIVILVTLLPLVGVVIVGALFMILSKLNLVGTDGDWGTLDLIKSVYSDISDFSNEEDDGADNENENELVDHSESESGQDGVLKLVIGISAGLIVLLSLAIAGLWIFSEAANITIGGPPSALLTWEDEYRDMTGVDAVSGDGTGVVLCIVDSGIDPGHPDLQKMNLIGWYDAIGDLDSPYDDQGHGTAMAGIVVAQDGLTGNAPGVSLLVAKAIDDQGVGNDDQIADSVDWCVASQADVISLSLGGAQGFGSGLFTTDALEAAVEDAIDQGVFVVAAAGNDGEDDDGDVESPGSVEDVICVGGVTRTGAIWTGSSQGDNDGRIWPNPIFPRSDPDKKPEVVAPGHEVPILMAGGLSSGSWWGWSSGTSASTAWVSGALALILEEHPELQREGDSGGPGAVSQMKEIISDNSQMKESQNEHDDHYGYGLLRVDLLLETLGNSSSSILDISNQFQVNIEDEVSESVQARRSTARVPPVSSTNPRE